MYCAKCGANVPDGMTVCPVCGLAVSPEPQAPEADPVSSTAFSADPYAEFTSAAPEQPYAPPANPREEFRQVTYVPDKAIYSPDQSVYGPRYSTYGYNRYLYDQNRAAWAEEAYGQADAGYGYTQEASGYEQPAATGETPLPADETAAGTEAASAGAAEAGTDYAAAFDSVSADDYYGTGDYYGAGDPYAGYADPYAGYADPYAADPYMSPYYDNYGYAPNASFYAANPIYVQPMKPGKQKKEKKPKAKLKWFKFLIYFHFFWFAATSVIYGIFLLINGYTLVLNAVLDYLRGMPLFEQDGPLLDGLSEIFGEIFGSMRLFGIILAAVTILMAVFGIVVRIKLAKYQRVGPKLLSVFFLLRMVFKIAFNGLAVFFFAKGFTALLDEFPYMSFLYWVPFVIMIPSALFTLLVMLLSKKYFKKRRDLFNKPELPEEQPPQSAEAQPEQPMAEGAPSPVYAAPDYAAPAYQPPEDITPSYQAPEAYTPADQVQTYTAPEVLSPDAPAAEEPAPTPIE